MMSEKTIIQKVEFFIRNSAINKMDSDFYKNGGWEVIDLEISKAVKGLLELYKNIKEIEQQHKTDNGLLRQELDMQIEHNKELEVTLKQTQNSWFEDTQKLKQEKERNEKLRYKIDEKELIIDGMKEDRRIAIEEIREEYYISKDKIKELLENEIIDISGFRCIAVEDIENLLEEK